MNAFALVLALRAAANAATFELPKIDHPILAAAPIAAPLSPIAALPLSNDWKIDLGGDAAAQPARLPIGPKGPRPLTAGKAIPVPVMRVEPDAKPPVQVRTGRQSWLESMFDRRKADEPEPVAVP